MILGFTGHRIIKNYENTYKLIKNKLIELNPEKTITGMAIGADQLFAVICIRLNIPFIAAIPFIGQEEKWTDKCKKQYNQILNKAKDVIIISDGKYSNEKYFIRNEWIVNKSDKILAYFDGNYESGTGHCIKFAEKQNKEIIKIY